MWIFDLQRFATAGPSTGSGRAKRKRSTCRGRAAEAMVCPLRRPSTRARRPARSTPAKSPGALRKEVPPAPTPSLTAKYVVQPGDTLHRIARRFGTTARLLADLNELHKPSLLVPGEIILVPDSGGG